MCLYPKLIKNKKYTFNKKNNGVIPRIKDERVLYVPIKCGYCIECQKERSRMWVTRLNEELRVSNTAQFLTLTYSNDAIKAISNKYNIKSINEIVKKSIRLFNERYRKINHKAIRHLFITELGGENRRIHLHGITFNTTFTKEKLEKLWQYGIVYIGDYVNTKTINYITKYITKINPKEQYRPIVLASPGIGKEYTNRYAIKDKHKYRDDKTITYYTLNNGTKINLPIYYRNKLFSEEEREQLWINQLNKHETYIHGIKVDISSKEGIQDAIELTKEMQKKYEELGTPPVKWNEKKYTKNIIDINL